MRATLTIETKEESKVIDCSASVFQCIIPQSKYTDLSHDQNVMQVRFTTGEVFDNVMEIEFYN